MNYTLYFVINMSLPSLSQEKERDHYSQFLAEPFEEYVSRKKKDRCYGNNTEIQAIAEIFNRPVEVFSYGQTGNL